MTQLYRQQLRPLDLKALAYSVIGGVSFLFTLMILGPGIDDKGIDTLKENSLGFFVRCNTNDCSSLITPFFAYLFNIEKNLEYLLNLWIAINTLLSAYLFLKLAQIPIKSKHAFSIAAMPFALVVMNVFNLSSLITILPCALSTLLASVLYAQGGRNWAYFITGAVLFSLPMGFLLFGSVICYLMCTKEGKQNRRDMLRIIHSIALGCAMIIIYLLLIKYNFLEWTNTVGAKEEPGNRISRLIGYSLSYVTTSIALISIHDKKIK